jgi:DNA-directed RNA polymerase subunit RPC12/RpoP
VWPLVEHMHHRLGLFHGGGRLQKPEGGDHALLQPSRCVSAVDRRLEAYVLRATTMSIDFTCQKCEASFELDVQDLIEGTEKLVCPHCDAKAPANLSEDFVAALTEMRAQIAALSKKFAVSMTLESEELEDELEDEDEDEDEEESEEDDDELDFDEDEDVEDDEDYDEDEDDER